ncbi:conserved protein, unknown function [Hepatocystis sp. ex Piliocolobus tephrosceles]|nr:conserved protein, unknown function [Hepatocystis sp. ex Piliocolobus tephrosceles]
MENSTNYTIYVLHSSTLYLILYAYVQVIFYLMHVIFTSKLFQLYFLKIKKLVKIKYIQYFKSAEYQDIYNKIVSVQKKIKKYNKIIEQNKEENKHLSGYDMLLLNGKYTRIVLKEKKKLDILFTAKQEQNKNISSINLWNIIHTFFCSNIFLITHIRKQIYIVLIFLCFKFFLSHDLNTSYIKMYSPLGLEQSFRILFKEPFLRNILNFLYNYNIARLFVTTMNQHLKSIFYDPLKKTKYISKT